MTRDSSGAPRRPTPPLQAGDFRALAEHVPDNVARLDTQLRYLYANPAFQATMGLAPEQYLGKTHREIGIPTEIVAPWDEAIDAVIATGEPRLFESSYTGPRGERRYEARLVPEFDTEGRLESVLMVSRDITERWRAEAALRESRASLEASEARIRTMFNSSPVGMFMVDAQGNTTFANLTVLELLGMSSEEVLGLGWADAVHPDDRPPLMEKWRSVLERGGGSFEATYRFVKTPSGERTIHQRVTAIVQDGKLHGFVGALEDITDRLQLEEQLRQRQKMEVVGRLAGGIAHDFNNLLTVILNAVWLLAPHQAPAQVELLRQVELAAQRAAALTMQLLAFGRRKPMQARVIELNELVERSTAMLRRLIGEHIQLEAVRASAPFHARVDVNMMEQVLMNLVVNARDALPDGGRITVRLEPFILDEAAAEKNHRCAGNYVCMSVEDTGLGIAPEHVPRIFEPFYTTKAAGKGTGLGLAIVHGIVHQHNGWIDVESEPGRGSTFRVYLPRVAASEPFGPEGEQPPPHGSETILLVEDESAVRAMLRAALERTGYRVVEAVDAQAARRLFRAHGKSTIDLLITDLVMPGHPSGQDLAAQLRAEAPGLRVLFMSGYGGHELAREAGTAFIQKPFNITALGRVIRDLLDA